MEHDDKDITINKEENKTMKFKIGELQEENKALKLKVEGLKKDFKAKASNIQRQQQHKHEALLKAKQQLERELD